MSARSRNRNYNDSAKLPRLFNNNAKSKIPQPTALPSREEFQNQLNAHHNHQQQQISYNLRNDLVPHSLDTFCESTKEFLKDENTLKKSKLIQTEFGKYAFVNEHGILLNKFGPVSILISKHFLFSRFPNICSTWSEFRRKKYYFIELELISREKQLQPFFCKINSTLK
jgi:hypothetical protein